MFDDQDGLDNENMNEDLNSNIVDDDSNDNAPSLENNFVEESMPISQPTEDAPVESTFEDLTSTISNEIPQVESPSSDDTPVTVQPVRFASFDEEENVHGNENRNLDLLMNVNLQMSVELGRTELPFKKVLELTRGSIISLDKLAGEPVELFANGKLVAFGEVVVIEDNFGLRITSIAAPEERLKTVHENK